MKTITVPGDPSTLTAVMVPMNEIEYHDHETIHVVSSDGSTSVVKTIFRVVDGGEDKWELQFE